MMRRLDPIEDEQLVREALGWINEQPKFYQDCDRAWGNDSVEDYLDLMRGPQADFGIFHEKDLVAVITISLEGKGIFNSHLMVRRGTEPEMIARGAINVIKGLLEQGLMREGWSWIARKNYGARRILEMIGMRWDGVSRYKGKSHNQPIEWIRYFVRAT